MEFVGFESLQGYNGGGDMFGAGLLTPPGRGASVAGRFLPRTAMATLLFDERIEIPLGIQNLSDFRRWALSDDGNQRSEVLSGWYQLQRTKHRRDHRIHALQSR